MSKFHRARTIAGGLILLILFVIFSMNWLPSAKAARGARFNSLHYAIIGDAGRWNKNNQRVRDSVVKSGVTNLILPGDNLYEFSGGYERVWEPWSKAGLNFSVVAIGNHTAGYKEEVEFFGMPGESYAQHPAPDVLMVVLNSDNRTNVLEQLRWADDVLTRAKESLVFLVYHHPSLTISNEHPWKERADFQRGMRVLMKKHRQKVTALINGHDHVATLVEFDDIPVIVSGATQNIRRGLVIDGEQEGMRVKTRWMFDEQPYWVRLELDPRLTRAEEARFHFVRAADNAITCSVRVVTGRAAELGSNCAARTRRK